MAFNKQVELIISDPSKTANVDISLMHIDFDIKRSITFSENKANFTIYNLKQDTANKILKKGNFVTFRAGYEDEGLGDIFIGNISTSSYFRRGADTITEINAIMNLGKAKRLDKVTFAGTYGKGILFSSVLKDLAKEANLSLVGIEKVTFTAPNGGTFVGIFRNVLLECSKILKPKGLGLFIDNNSLVIYEIGKQNSKFPTVRMEYKTGLLTANEIYEEVKGDKKRVIFTSIIVPKMQINGLINFKSERINGLFRIEKLHFFGNNYAESFNIDGECVA